MPYKLKTLLNGESKNVEYKLLPPSKSINYTKTAVAFANGQGGCLVFGIEDQTLRVAGIAEDRVFTVMDAISDAIVDSCEPLIVPDITMHDVDGKTVIVAEIAPGLQRPYFIKSLGRERGTFVRVAGTTRQADQPTIRELTIEGSNRSFDQVRCLGLSVTDEDIATLCAKLTETAKTNAENPAAVKTVTEKQLLQWGVLCEQDGKLEPTNAYAILTGSGVVRSVVQCGVFKGSTKAVFVDRREFTGTPQELIEASYQYVLRNIHMGARFKGVYRQDVYEIPPEAIRELIVNAVVHRSYIDHSSIQIAIYDDRLEITSPGRLPMGQTIERMKQGYSKIRNEALALAFEYMGYIEHWGSGILRVMQQVRDAGLPEPEFLGGDTDLRINIYRTNVNLSSDDAITTRLRRDSSSDDAITTRLRRDSSSDDAIAEKEFANEQDSRKLILDEIRNREWITTADAVRILGIQKRQVQRMLKDLIDEGFVARLGSGPSTRYVALSKKEETHE
ncbi:ATP-binding protein [Bifidobacterium adolescentis]|uniref:ATP-binding protein n=1 Tax=Bifidobacterium adolescentis TaxID=1680 RepID=A0A412KCE6_BIFAD|nr:ATP-binding protein [Bifidobacterium adolescentis]QHB62898.1 ATP-binding protein [Bifidobacterium adolescentis]RGS66337.1 ATP-binding protein [Bifidobacterium adolescentis]RGX60775.1 ATP-binding protein [Bifidobacterium adolescentis]GDY95794.1 ATPase AAA [Bifidobacteriaceae bacterium MCC01943]